MLDRREGLSGFWTWEENDAGVFVCFFTMGSSSISCLSGMFCLVNLVLFSDLVNLNSFCGSFIGVTVTRINQILCSDILVHFPFSLSLFSLI